MSSASRYHRWRQAERSCGLEDRSTCPRLAPTRLTPAEILAMKEMVESPEYGHVPTGRLAVLAQRLGKVFAATVAILRDAARGAVRAEEMTTLVTDAGIQNVNAGVDELIVSGLLRRVLALRDVSVSNSLIEAWWRTLKHQWLYLNALDSVEYSSRFVPNVRRSSLGKFLLRQNAKIYDTLESAWHTIYPC